MSAKKSGGGSAKKSSSKNDGNDEVYELRDVVLGKIRGFPPWPGMVVDPDTVPKMVAKERPANKKTVVHAVRFFPTGDYAWLPPRELTRLTHTAIKAFVDEPANGKKPKGGDLLEAYRKALDPEAWEADHAANPPPAKKSKKSKSKKSKKVDEDEEEEGGDDEDELEEAEAEADPDEDEKPTKKRKRASSPAPKSKAKAKAPAAKSKKGGKAKKSKAAVESEDEGGEDGDAEGGEEAPVSKKHKGGENASLESDPEALKVREWRHKLQKTFLSSNKSLPKEEEMPAVDALFTLVESYQNMNIDYLTFSKIGKVMRHIHLLEPHKVPRDGEFKFRDRAKALVDKWHQILNANKVPEGGDAAAAPADAEAEDEEAAAAADVNGEGDLTMMDVTMDES
ncbi:hypothetical protein FB45DRAFT_920497 [Roridomyces roridus]|uniref:PWWP domain-containing protein n=1 Tax=Roridomyces roridus TaxID=1738132 RepID=A0AAD7BPH8_9AGAR|nr:hypothetical protein FB45DRAFT_920497 [Roridomyces roridus]